MIAIENVDRSIKKDIIVEGLMRSKGVYLLVSKPKVGKSMFALQLAYSITNGIPFINCNVTASPVLYITTESDIYQIRDRMEYMNIKAKDNSLFLDDRNNKDRICLSDIEYKLASHSDENINKLLIIDMLKDFDIGIDYDINDFKDISQKLMPKIRNLADKYNFTILLTHHLNKKKETLGSTGFDACVDGVITLTESTDRKNIFLNTISRDFSSLNLCLKKDNNLLLSVATGVDDEISDCNLIQFIKYASIKKNFELTATEIVNEAKLFCTPKSFGKLVSSNINLLNNEGIHITKNRTSGNRSYVISYEEPNNNE